MEETRDEPARPVIRVLVLLAAALLLSYLFCSELWSAPAPFPRTQKPATKMEADRLAGRWTLHWNGGLFDLTLAPGGHYTCSSRSFALVWTGSWHVRGGRFWATESSRPEEHDSWRSYGCPLDHRTLEGTIDEGDFRGTKIRLER